MQSYIPTYYKLRKRELLTALGSHQVGWGRRGGDLISASAVPDRWGGVGCRFEHAHLAGVVPNCLVAFFYTYCLPSEHECDIMMPVLSVI